MFSGNNTSTTGNNSTGIFGNTANTGGMFGNNLNNNQTQNGFSTNTTGVFGNANTTNFTGTMNSNNISSNGGSIFGANTSNTNAFGNTSSMNNGNGMISQNQSTGNTFNSFNQGNQGKPTGSSIFGQNQIQQQSNNSNISGLLGNKSGNAGGNMFQSFGVSNQTNIPTVNNAAQSQSLWGTNTNANGINNNNKLNGTSWGVPTQFNSQNNNQGSVQSVKSKNPKLDSKHLVKCIAALDQFTGLSKEELRIQYILSGGQQQQIMTANNSVNNLSTTNWSNNENKNSNNNLFGLKQQAPIGQQSSFSGFNQNTPTNKGIGGVANLGINNTSVGMFNPNNSNVNSLSGFNQPTGNPFTNTSNNAFSSPSFNNINNVPKVGTPGNNNVGQGTVIGGTMFGAQNNTAGVFNIGNNGLLGVNSSPAGSNNNNFVNPYQLSNQPYQFSNQPQLLSGSQQQMFPSVQQNDGKLMQLPYTSTNPNSQNIFAGGSAFQTIPLLSNGQNIAQGNSADKTDITKRMLQTMVENGLITKEHLSSIIDPTPFDKML
eukprot:GHVR01000004.1.p1 GENE.GHVR01000004.1~~GHVR01000004.1.p1  ORF type:complete len:559 (-),score=47.92 GHVR01000004.1:753-2378(-)